MAVTISEIRGDMLTTLGQRSSTLWMPEQASSYAHEVDGLFYFIYWLNVFFFVLIGGLMIYFAWKYRQRDLNDNPGGSHHSNTLEVTWTVIPTIVVVIIFVWGFRGYRNMVVPPANSEEILVTASQWSWLFEYESGLVTNELHVPVDRPIKLILQSTDVIHAFFVPQFRTKQDIVPGRHNEVWFQAMKPGEYDLYCAEYCGQGHSQMSTKVTVELVEDFRSWVNRDPMRGKPPAEAGEYLYKVRGCQVCHSVDGSPGTGPTFLDLYGKKEPLRSGESVLVDEKYIYNSIMNPSGQIVKGFQDQMPLLALKDDEIVKITAYLKSISKYYQGSRDLLFELPELEDQGDASDSTDRGEEVEVGE